jgi:hypothetical protein
MEEINALIVNLEGGQSRNDFDDGKDWVPAKIWDARRRNSILEYHLQYHGHPGRSWTHHNQFNDALGEDRGWNQLVVDFWQAWLLDKSLTTVQPPDPFPQPRYLTRSKKSLSARSQHARSIFTGLGTTSPEDMESYRDYDEWKSLDQILEAAHLTQFKNNTVDITFVHHAIQHHIEHQHDNELADLEALLFGTDDEATVSCHYMS